MNNLNQIRRGQRFTFSGQDYEIIHITESEILYKRSKGGAPNMLASERFHSLVTSGEIKLHNIELMGSDEQLLLTDEQIKERDRRLAYVQKILNSTSKPTKRSVVNPLIKSIADERQEAAPGFSTVGKWIKRYTSSGYRPNSLVDNNHLKGNRIKKLCHQAQVAMHEVVKNIYLSKQRHSVSYAYNEMCNLYLNGEISRVPSLRTFERYVKNISEHQKIRARYGSLKASKLLRAAGASPFYSRPLEAVQADGQVMDILIVDDQTGEILGRPNATILIDVYTRCIISVVISMRGFSAGSVLQALKFALTGSYSGFGGHIETLHVDNGADYTSQSMKNLANNLGIQIDYAAPNEPNLKAQIERFFKSLNTGLIHHLPGTTWSNPEHRDTYPSEKKAVVTLDQLQSLVKKWIDNDYHKRIHEGTERAPSALWQESASEHPVHVYPMEHIDMLARKVERRKISKGRVRYQGLTWYSHVLAAVEAELIAKRVTRKVDVYIDITNLSYVLIKDPLKRNNFIRADSTRPEFTELLSLEEYQKVKEKLKLRTSSDLERYPTEQLIKFRKKMSMEIELLNDPQSRRLAKNVRKKLQRERQKAKLLSNVPQPETLSNSTNKELKIDMNFDAHNPENLD